MDRGYELFARIVEAGSLSAAARQIGISPGMVSKRLAHLEGRLGTRLIHRTTRRLELTEAGAVFHADVMAILAAMGSAEARVSGQETLISGLLRISAPTSFGRMYVAPCLKAFLDDHPRLSVELDLSDSFTDLVGERIDLAIRIAPAIGSGLTANRLGASRRVLCAAPAYLEEHAQPLRIGELEGHHLLAATGQLPWRLDGPGGAIVVNGESRVRTNSSEVARELTISGAGISLRSLWDVHRDIAEGRLVRVLPAYEGSSSAGIYAVHPKAPAVPANVAAFIHYLRRLYASPPWEG